MPVAGVGDTASAEKHVTEDEIETYADVTGDHNPLHLDAEYAADGLFGGVVAHGMLAAGVVSAALASLPGDVVYVSQDISFTAPVRPGDTIEAHAEVVEDLGEDRLRVETTAETENGTVVEGHAVVLSLEHGA